MKAPKLPPLPPGTSSSISLALLLLWLVYSGYPALGIGLVVLAEAYRFWAKGDISLEAAIKASPSWILSLSMGLLITLMPKFPTQIALAVLYAAWRIWLRAKQEDESSSMVIAAVSQFLALAAIFLAAAVWHWHGMVVVVLSWVSSWLVARKLLSFYNDPSTSALSAAWALVVAECTWIFSLWLVNYIVLEGYLIIPQAAVVITSLGYCFGGVYIWHRRSQLSRSRLVEYMMISMVLLAIVIAGTKWNGVI